MSYGLPERANRLIIKQALNEAESAKLLTELRKQGYDKPIFGETVLLSQSVLDLAGEAANGVQGHVGLSVAKPRWW